MFQRANAGLQDQVYALSEKLKEERGKALNPDLLRQRLEDMAQLLASRVCQIIKIMHVVDSKGDI